MPPKPLVAVSTDFRQIDNRHLWHMTPSTYVDAVLEASGVLPVLVPSFGARLPLDDLLDQVDGVVLTGSKSNVHPALYGVAPSEAHEPYDPARDATTLPLIRAAIGRGVPLIAICRGFQELNVALGGSLDTEIQDLPGRMDHRSPVHDDMDVRYGIRQGVTIVAEGCLGRILPPGEIQVNSLHRQGIAHLSPRLAIEAVAPDGTIEAVSVTDSPAFAVGVQWHPEYWATSDAPSRKLFEAFGDAVRARQAARLGIAPAVMAAE
jgi:putative glutamine amidotransferase